MRGTKAKRLRKKVYGELYIRAARKYAYDKRLGCIVNTGIRRNYQIAKALVKSRVLSLR